MGINRNGVNRLSLKGLSYITGGQIYSFPCGENTTRYCFPSRKWRIEYADELPLPAQTSHLSDANVIRCSSAREAERNVYNDLCFYHAVYGGNTPWG